MTTLLLSENFPPKTGGSSRWFWEIYSRLPREQFVVAAGDDEDQHLVDGTTDLRIVRLPLTFPTRYLRPSTAGYYRRALVELRSLTQKQKIKRIHAARCLHEGLIALFLKLRSGIPYTCFAHGEEVNLSNNELHPRWFRRRVYNSREMALIDGVVLRNASHVLANSENTRSILTDRWCLPSDRVHLLYPGVDTARFHPAPPDSELRAKLGWLDRRVLLTVGRLQKRKGHDVLISALPEIQKAIPNLVYAIVGNGEELESLERLVNEHQLQNVVQFLHQLNDTELIECYQQCDLFVLPNREIEGDIEGFGMVLLEAQACGKPVVAGASGGTAETMRIPETGLVVDCQGPDELAARLAELLGDPGRLEVMGREGRDWVVGKFDWQNLARQAERLFAKLE